MAKEWNGIVDSDFSEEEERLYDESITAIKNALDEGLGFDEACGRISLDDEAFRNMLIDDYLKISVAEFHFNKGEPLEDLAARFRIPEERLVKAKQEMLEEVQQASIDVFHAGQDAARKEGGGESAGNA